MSITLTRVVSSEKGTFGAICIDDMPVCVTCEDPWKGNERQLSCIPAGTYQCENYSSAKFPDTWEVKDVPGRSAILIHAGNTIADTEGCILVGTSFGSLQGAPAITGSKLMMDRLRLVLPDSFTLTIKEGY